MKLKTTILFFLITYLSFSQNDFIKHEKNNFSIEYPKDWRLDVSGMMNSEVILFSPLKENDSFSENVNMMIQDLAGQGFTMESYIKLSESQIKGVAKGEIFKNTFDKDHHVLVWKGNVTGQVLKFKQYFFLKEEKIYMLTLTAYPNTFDEYLDVGNKILNSFKLN